MSCNYPGIHHASHLKSYLYHDLCGSSSINIKAIDRSLCTYLRNPRGFCMLRCPTLDSFVSRAQQNFLSKVYSYLFGLSLSSWGHCRQWPQKKEQMSKWRSSVAYGECILWRQWYTSSPLVPLTIVIGAIGDRHCSHHWCHLNGAIK